MCVGLLHLPMQGGVDSVLGWRDVVDAVSGYVGVQVDGEYVHVSEEWATVVGVEADALVGADWRTAFDGAEADRLERAVEAARTAGRWEGQARVGENAVELTLSATDEGALLWVFGDRVSDQGGREGPPPERQARLFSRPEFVRTVLDAVDDVVYVIDEDGQFYLWNETLAETTGYTHAEIGAIHPKELVAEHDHEYVPGLIEAIGAIENRRVDVDINTKDGEDITHEFKGTTFEDPETGERFRCGLARDVTEERERERELERRLEELATLDNTNEILLETVRELVESPTRQAVERLVCRRLAASDLYRFAWMGERGVDGHGVRTRASAGATLDGGRAATEGSAPLAERAVRTREIQVLTADSQAFDPWRDGAVKSVGALPLRNDGSVHGVLVVGATREDAFGGRERDALDVLGRTVGFVVDAARRHELLFADSVLELEFRVDDADTVLFGAATTLDCRLELDGYVATGDDWVLYCSVDGAATENAADALAADERTERARPLDDDRVELVASSSLLDAVVAAGAVVDTGVVDRGRGRLVVEAPLSVGAREVVERLRRHYPDIELHARRERERSVATAGRPGGVLDSLTDRQREVLEAAYLAGYFAWPRESTAEEVAETLDIDASTLHGHLRKAESTVLAALFADDDADE